MNSTERLNIALNHEEPDRVPYDLAGTTVTSISKKAFVRAMDYRELPPDYEKNEVDPIQQIVTPVEEILIQLRPDTRRIGARRIPDFENQLIIKNGIREITDQWGCLWRMDASKDLYYNQMTCPLGPFECISEGLKNYMVPDLADHWSLIRNDMSEQAKNIGEYGVVADRNCAGLTEMSMRIRGYEKWFMDTVTDPSGVERLLDLILEHKLTYWDLVIDWLVENNLQNLVLVISECDDLGSQTSTILEPDYLRNAVIPRFEKLWSYIKSRMPHIKIFMHTCGAVRELLPDLIEAGMDIYNPVQFTAAGMELKELKKDFGKDLVFWGGGVDTQNTLRKGSPDEVKDEVMQIIDIMAPGGGFVFATIHNIQEDVPPENFWAMWETLMDYGSR